MKTWKTIPGFSLYEASSDGEIKTYNWKNLKREAIMKPAMDNSGYLRTMLKRDSDGKIGTIKVHRIIAQTFIPNPENKPEVNHKNSIRNDNRVINLEWVTHSENVKHSFYNGIQNNKGQNNPCASLTDEQVLEIRSKYTFGKKTKCGKTKAQLAKEYNTTFNVIKQLVQGRTWKHLL